MSSILIPTTTISTAVGNGIDIFTFYNKNTFNCDDEDVVTDLPYIVLSSITDDDSIILGELIEEEHLYIIANNFPLEIDFFVDENGELIISSFDSNSYYIDDNGHLIYNFCETNCDDDAFVQCDYVDDNYID